MISVECAALGRGLPQDLDLQCQLVRPDVRPGNLETMHLLDKRLLSVELEEEHSCGDVAQRWQLWAGHKTLHRPV